jgi:RNA polymerase-binding transcription factor DksA
MSLSTDQLAHLERRLREERELLLAPLREFAKTDSARDEDEPAGDDVRMPQHLADIGTATQQEELDATLATRRSAELGEIDAALDRIARTPQLYGIDEQTGDDIPFERLDVIPWTRANVTPDVAAADGASH